MNKTGIINILLALIVSPFLLGIINRTKAFFGGRKGQPLFQTYYDLLKLLRKGAVYSKTTSWVFRAGPVVGLSCVFTALFFVPFGGVPAIISFSGDLFLFAYLLGVMRFFTVIAALDTGSAFEGMGASREVQFSALAEPALLIGFVAVAKKIGDYSLSQILTQYSIVSPELILVAVSFLIVFLCENARIPFDDPNTHLELTMIHEVMVLDHSGPDFAFILYGSALKLWILGSLVTGTLFPSNFGEPLWMHYLFGILEIFALAVVVGIIESIMARLRLNRVHQLLITASALSIFAFIFVMR